MTEPDRDAAGGDHVDRRDRWLVVAAFASALLAGSLIPVSWVAPAGGLGNGGGGALDALPVDVGLTDPFHFVGYALLTVLASRVTGRSRRGLLLAAGAAVAFGFGIELVQAPTPWRSFAWADAAVNALGAAAGIVVVVAVDALAAIAPARDRRS